MFLVRDLVTPPICHQQCRRQHKKFALIKQYQKRAWLESLSIRCTSIFDGCYQSDRYTVPLPSAHCPLCLAVTGTLVQIPILSGVQHTSHYMQVADLISSSSTLPASTIFVTLQAVDSVECQQGVTVDSM